MSRCIVLLCLAALPCLADETGDLAKQLSAKESDLRLAAARTAATNQDKKLLSPLIKLLKDKNPAVRTAAIEALAMRAEPKHQKTAALALARRLGPLEDKEKDRTELLAVIQALHDLAQPATIKALLDVKTGSDADSDVIRARAMAVGNVPSKAAIERLITFGYKNKRGPDRTGRAATQALAYATQVRVKGAMEQWRKWWKENEKTFDPVAAAEKRKEKRAQNADKEAKRKERAEKRKEKKRKKKGDA